MNRPRIRLSRLYDRYTRKSTRWTSLKLCRRWTTDPSFTSSKWTVFQSQPGPCLFQRQRKAAHKMVVCFTSHTRPATQHLKCEAMERCKRAMWGADGAALESEIPYRQDLSVTSTGGVTHGISGICNVVV